MIGINRLIYSLILFYPLLYGIPGIQDGLGHFFEVIYFSMLFPLILMNTALNVTNIKLSVTWLVLLGVFFSWVIGFNEVSNARPYFYLLGLIFISLYVSQDTLHIGDVKKISAVYIVLFITLSVVFFMFDSAYIDDGERYKGFAMSPTHFSVYALCTSVIAYNSFLQKKNVIICFVAFSLLIFFSETRLSLLVFILITSIFLFSEHIKKHLKLYFVMLFLFFSLSYPIYGVIYQYTKVVSLRYEGDADKSFDSRLLIQQVIFDEFSRAEEKDLLLGHGAEAARNRLIQFYGQDVMPHNDYIRIIYDYGLLGFTLFVMLLYFLSTKNIYTLSFSAIYLSSFYHNMAFSLYVIAMIIISGKIFECNNKGGV